MAHGKVMGSREYFDALEIAGLLDKKFSVPKASEVRHFSVSIGISVIDAEN